MRLVLLWTGLTTLLATNPQVLSHYLNSRFAQRDQLVGATDFYGNALFVWRSYREGALYPQLYGQWISLQGMFPWGKQGLLLNEESGYPDQPQLYTLNDHTFLLLYLLRTKEKVLLRMRMIDRSGRVFPAKTFPLPHKPWKTFSATLVNRRYLYIAAWHDNKPQQIYLYYYDLEEQKGWQQGIVVATANSLSHVRFCMATPLYCVLAWEQFEEGTWYTYLNKIDKHQAFVWKPQGIRLTLPKHPLSTRNASVISDGFGGILVAFEVYQTNTFKQDIYIARISAKGKIVYIKPLCHYLEAQERPFLLKQGGKALVLWIDFRQQRPALFAQQFRITDGKLQWHSVGIEVCNSRYEPQSYQVVYYPVFQYALLVWRTKRGQLYGLKLEQDLSNVVQRKPFWLSVEAKQVKRFVVLSDERGGFWCAWMNADGMQVQRYNVHGFAQFTPAEGKALVQPLQQNKVYIGQHAAVKDPYTKRIYVVWQDFRNGDKDPDFYWACFDSTGRLLWQPQGRPLLVQEGVQTQPALYPCKQGVLLLWIEQKTIKENRLFAWLLDKEGYPLWEKPIVVCDAPGARLQPKALILQDTFIIYWTDTRSMQQTGFDLYAQALSSTGIPLWWYNGIALVKKRGFQTDAHLLRLPKGWLLVWMDDSIGYYQYHFQWINPKRLPVIEPFQGNILFPAWSHQRNLSIHLYKDKILWLWSDASLGEQKTQVFMQVTDLSLKALLRSPVRVAPVAAKQVNPHGVFLDDNQVLVLWNDSREEYLNGYLLCAQQLQLNPLKRLLGMQGNILGKFLRPFTRFQIAMGYRPLIAWEQQIEQHYQVLWQVYGGRSIHAARRETYHQALVFATWTAHRTPLLIWKRYEEHPQKSTHIFYQMFPEP